MHPKRFISFHKLVTVFFRLLELETLLVFVGDVDLLKLRSIMFTPDVVFLIKVEKPDSVVISLVATIRSNLVL